MGPVSMARRLVRRLRSALAKPNAAAMRGLAAAREALCADVHGPTGDEAIALLEQQRREDDARRAGQGVLPLQVSESTR